MCIVRIASSRDLLMGSHPKVCPQFCKNEGLEVLMKDFFAANGQWKVHFNFFLCGCGG